MRILNAQAADYFDIWKIFHFLISDKYEFDPSQVMMEQKTMYLYLPVVHDQERDDNKNCFYKKIKTVSVF